MKINIDRIDYRYLSTEDKANIMLEEARALHFVLDKEGIDWTSKAYIKVIDNRWELHQGLRDFLLENQHYEFYDVDNDGTTVYEGQLLWKRYYRSYMSLSHAKIWVFDGKLALSVKKRPEDQFIVGETFEPRRVTVQVDRQTLRLFGADIPRVSRVHTFAQDEVSQRTKTKRPTWVHPDKIKAGYQK